MLLPLGLPSSHQAPQLPSREAVEASGRRVVLCFGASLTAGLTPCGQFTPYSCFLSELMASNAAEGIPDYIVLNAGICGETTQEMCRRFREVLFDYEDLLAWVIILGGTNDLPECRELGSPAVCRTVDNLKQLHLMVHSAGYNIGARTVVMTVPECMKDAVDEQSKPYSQEQQHINGELRSFAGNRSESILVDVAEAFPQDQENIEAWEPNGLGTGDGVHFSTDGYRLLVKLIFEELRKDAAQRGWPGSEVLSGSSRESDGKLMQPPPLPHAVLETDDMV